MVKNNADVELVTHVKRSLAALDEYESSFKAMMNKMDRSLKRNEKRVKSTGEKFANWGKQMGKAAVGALGFLGVMQSVYTVAGLITREIAKQAELNTRSKGMVFDYMTAKENLRFMIPDQPGVVDSISEKIIQSKVPNKPALANMVTGFISAGLSDKPEDMADEAIKLATLRPELLQNEGAGQALAEAVSVIQGATGQPLKNVLGSIVAGAGASRSTDLAQFSEYMVGAASQGLSYGYTTQESLARLAALSTQANDRSGQMTATNWINFVAKLQAKGKEFGVDETAKQLEDRMQDLNDPIGAQLKEFYSEEKNMPGRGRMKLGLVQLTQTDAEAKASGQPRHARTLLNTSMGIIPKIEDAGGIVDSKMKDRLKDPMFQAFQLNEATKNAENQALLDPERAKKSALIDNLDTMVTLYGDSAFSGRLKKFKAQVAVYGGVGSAELGMQLNSEIDDLQANILAKEMGWSQLNPFKYARGGSEQFNRSREYAKGKVFSGRTDENAEVYDKMSEASIRQLEYLQGMEDRLREIRDAIVVGQATPQPIKDSNPKLSEPAEPGAGVDE